MNVSPQTGFFQKVSAAWRKKVFRHWVVAWVAGYLLSSLFISGIMAFTAIYPINTTAGFELVFALLVGLGFSLPQWFVLRHYFRKVHWWIVATALGSLAAPLLIKWVATPMLNTLAAPSVWSIAPIFVTDTADTIAQAICYGVTIGTAQWLFFRTQNIERATAWIVATIIASILSYLVPRPYMSAFIQRTNGSLPLMYTLLAIAATSVQGIIKGCLTGYVLVGFLDQADRRSV